MDFYKIRTSTNKEGDLEVYPSFVVDDKLRDIMFKSGNFYAIYDQQTGLWSKDEYDVKRMVDGDIWSKRKQLIDSAKFKEGTGVIARPLSDDDNGMWRKWRKYSKNMPDNYKQLDSTLTFASDVVKLEDYRSKRLNYDLSDAPCPAYTELISRLYEPSEREKLEWAIGCVVAGMNSKVQKFVVLYGEKGTGKSTVINIIEKLFKGYTVTFNAKALGSASDNFATEAFSENPLVAIQQDGDLSRIEDNTRLNSIVAHEKLLVNVKHEKHRTEVINAFLFMGSNSPVRITDSKSGLIRRLIDVSPTGQKFRADKYDRLVKQIDFELGAIAKHCLDVFNRLGKDYYNHYEPVRMIVETDFFYNFMEENYSLFKQQDGTTVQAAYDMYKSFCKDNGVDRFMVRNRFRSELGGYFKEFLAMTRVNGKQVRSWYSGFKAEKFDGSKSLNDILEAEQLARAESEKAEKAEKVSEKNEEKSEYIWDWIELKKQPSLLDIMLKDCLAQYTKLSSKTKSQIPIYSWDKVTTKLIDIDTSRVHYVKPPIEHIVIDFDLKDKDGNKSKELNLEAAAKWPKTYAEFSQGGSGLHLHYIYTGDPEKLKSTYAPDIEIKVFKGLLPLRRRLSYCNDIPVATISSGLPVKEETTVINDKVVQNEKHLRALIEKALRKEIEPGRTVTSIDFINFKLNEAYESGIPYDVRDLRQKILIFGMKSTHNASYCIGVVNSMKFASEGNPEKYDDEPPGDSEGSGKDPLQDPRRIFFDLEVLPNVVLICWKYEDDDHFTDWFNPTSADIEWFLHQRLYGYNCRRYDNHILWAIHLGKSVEEIFKLSCKIINSEKGSRNDAFFGPAYNLSEYDVYDGCSKKQSLKMWEIDLDIPHKEFGWAWDKELPKEMWIELAKYCHNDVYATEQVFKKTMRDFEARNILVKMCQYHGVNACLNDTTNSLTTKLILRGQRGVQSQFVKPDLSKLFPGYENDPKGIDKDRYIGKIVSGKSIYHGMDPGEGGHVFAKPGTYWDVVTFDVASMHPSSIIAENGFGPFTANFKELLDIRLHIKHKEYDVLREMYGGLLAPYLQSDEGAKALSFALKIAINSVYGLTSANFPNELRDPRNTDNWVAKRGALMMMSLHEELDEMGADVLHIKTDSIKVSHPTQEIRDFIVAYGKKYGYTFEIEDEYERIALMNESVYIAREKHPDPKDNPSGWVATGAQFLNPYVKKTIFSHEPYVFSDFCEKKSVHGDYNIYLDNNETVYDEDKEKELTKLIDKSKKQLEKLEPDDLAREEFNKTIADCQEKIDKMHN